MPKRLKIITIIFLAAYSFILFLAISPLHIMLFDKIGFTDFSHSGDASLRSEISYNTKVPCPLCAFLRLLRVPAMAAIFLLIFLIVQYLVLLATGKSAIFQSPELPCFGLAPPWSLPYLNISKPAYFALAPPQIP